MSPEEIEAGLPAAHAEMSGVLQTRMAGAPGGGNCLAACIATIVGVPIDEVPENESGAAMGPTRDWLASRGLSLVNMRATGDGFDSFHAQGLVPLILCGASPRDPKCDHAIVARFSGWGHEVLHDPHPDGGGIVGRIKSIILIVPSASGGIESSK